MKIGFISLYFPYPPAHGSPQRALNLIKQLHSRGHRVFLHAFSETQVPESHQREVKKYCEQVKVFQARTISNRRKAANLLFSGLPNIALPVYRPDIVREIADDYRSSQCDVVYTEILGVAEYGRRLKQLYQAKWINGSENVEFRRTLSYLDSGWGNIGFDVKRPYIYLSAMRLKRYERRLLQIADATIVCTDEDKQWYRELHPNENIFVIGHGVELSADLTVRKSQRRTVGFVGMMNSLPNVQAVLYFVRDVLPIITQAVPDVEFLIIGDKPPPDILSLRSETVRVLGYVENLSSIIDDIALFVVPLVSGGGIKTKTLLAMAHHKPVVSTSHGATGLNVTNGKELFIGDDPASFAGAVVNLFNNDELYVEVAKNGYEYVKHYHSWEHCGKLFDEVLGKL
jgi:glycosyltransferase involved in cell wall biosynthesis